MQKKSITQIRNQAYKEISSDEYVASIKTLKSKKVAIFIVAYNAQSHLELLIERMPKELLPLFSEIFIIDDSSKDKTYSVAMQIAKKYSNYNINVYQTPFNRGYGGNQKIGYLYCIKKGCDILVLLHGDGQYAPENLHRILAAFNGNVAAVFA